MVYPPPSGADPTATSGGISGLGGAGFALSAFGAAYNAVGAFFGAKSQQKQLESGALSAEHEASIANLNARAAESDAQAILAAGQRDVGLTGLRYAQEKGSSAASAAARGVQAGVGSAAEVQASIEFAKQVDQMTITADSVRSAEAQRTRATDLRNRSALSLTSARNLRRTARSINPWSSAAASLLGGGGQLASQAAYLSRY